MIENSEGSLGKIQFSVGPAFFVSWWNWKRRCWLPCGCECHSVLIGNISSPMSFGALRYGSAAWAPSLICNFDNLTTWLVPSQIDIFGIPALTSNHFCYSSCPKTSIQVHMELVGVNRAETMVIYLAFESKNMSAYLYRFTVQWEFTELLSRAE